MIAELITDTEMFYGLRRDARDFEVGDEVPVSYLWDFSNDCSSDTPADGTSSIGLGFGGYFDDDGEIAKQIQLANKYSGRMYLIAGRHAGYGDGDEGEVVIADTVVVAVL